MTDEKTRDEIQEQVLTIFIECVGWITREQMILDLPMEKGLKVHDGDITEFMWEVEKEFDMRLTQNEWGRVGTLQETIDLVMQYRGVKLRPEEDKRWWVKLWKCLV